MGRGRGRKKDEPVARAVARKVGAYEALREERKRGQRGRSYDKRRKRKTAKERVPFIQRSRRKRQRCGRGARGGVAVG